MASPVRACKITGTDDHSPQNTLANCTCTVQRLSRRRSWCPQTSWRHLRQTPILWPPSATHRPSCCSTDRLPSKIFEGAGHSWPLCCLQGIRPPDAGVLPTGLGWCSSLPPLSPRQNPEARPLPDWTCGQCRQSGSPPQREQHFACCHKLMSGPRLPTLANLLPPQRAPPTEPRTRRQLAETHPFQLSVTLPRKSNDTILRSFPYGPIAAWNSLPASVVRAAPASKDLQGFKTRAYNHVKRQNWLWATDAL